MNPSHEAALSEAELSMISLVETPDGYETEMRRIEQALDEMGDDALDLAGDAE